jgi:two-component system NtrC family sensor kinase
MPGTRTPPSCGVRTVWTWLLLLVSLSISTPLLSAVSSAERTVTLSDHAGGYVLGRHAWLLEDRERQLTLDDILSDPVAGEFRPSTSDGPSFGFTSSAWWSRVTVQNTSRHIRDWILVFDYAPMQWLDVFVVTPDGRQQHIKGGQAVPYRQRAIPFHKHAFPLDLPPGSSATLYVRSYSEGNHSVSLALHDTRHFMLTAQRDIAAISLYAGITLALLAYNLFIFLTLRERTFLYYVIFLTCNLGFQLSLFGLIQPLLLSDIAQASLRTIPAGTALTAISGGIFTMAFLRTRTHHPVLHRLLTAALVASAIGVILPWLTSYTSSMQYINVLMISYILLVLLTACLSLRRGNPVAGYYLMAWAILLLGAIVVVLRNVGILPLSAATDYAILWGSAAEGILLSVALAARMRTMKQDNKETREALLDARAEAALAQEEALANRQLALASQQTALKQQQIALEQEKLLVEKEKMASLGLLSAGIAHEINNPNHFIDISVNTAETRIRDLQGFIADLLADDADPELDTVFRERFGGILSQLSLAREGSQRITGIVKSMRHASRQDASTPSPFDPVESLLSTLELIRPSFKTVATFDTSRLETGHTVLGFASQLNQVFTNLIVNGCHAIEEKHTASGQREPGRIGLSSTVSGAEITIHVSDTGCGMTETVLAKLFQPFFTTKGADRGTGLGLGICRSIVSDHGGRMEVSSEEGAGTLFRVILPLAVHQPPTD